MIKYAAWLALGLAIPLATSAQPITQKLSGSWSLVSLVEDHNGRVVLPLGETPTGMIMYGSDGSLSLVFTQPGREKIKAHPATPVGPLIAYFGTYTFDGSNLVHRIKAGSYPGMDGTEQRAKVTIDADNLTLFRTVVTPQETFTATGKFKRFKAD